MPTGSVVLSKTNITLGVNETVKITASIVDTDDATQIINWSSSDTNVLTVDNGKITAKKTGVAVVTASLSNGNFAECYVTIKNAPASVSLNKTSLTLGVGETYDLNSKLPSGTAAHSIVYSSSNDNIVNVKSAGGFVTAKNTGTATVTATASDPSENG